MRATRRLAVLPSLALGALMLAAGCGDRSAAVAPEALDALAPAVAVASLDRKAPSARTPIEGRYAGAARAIASPGDPSRYRIEVTAEGITSHLGRSTAAWVVPDVRLDLAAGTLTVLSGRWRGTLTAANGDQIFGEYAFRTPVIALDALGGFAATTDLEITGGTGRFAGASGAATSVVRGSVLTGRFAVELEGRATLVVP